MALCFTQLFMLIRNPIDLFTHGSPFYSYGLLSRRNLTRFQTLSKQLWYLSKGRELEDKDAEFISTRRGESNAGSMGALSLPIQDLKLFWWQKVHFLHTDEGGIDEIPELEL